MKLIPLALAAATIGVQSSSVIAQTSDFKPVTDQMLSKPSAADWLMMNRTYDEQRYSPLKQINRKNVRQLRLAWGRGLPLGSQETVPIVYRGVMYTVVPGGAVMALDATNGDTIWEYYRNYPKDMSTYIGAPERARAKSIAIYQDMVYFNAPDGYLIAIDAKSGKLRWETKVHDYKQKTQHTGGPIVADGKVITNRTCETRAGCFIAAHDARTGKEVWKFYTTAGAEEPNGETWQKVETEKRVASSWGLPGSYDPVRKLTYWAIANPKPYTRIFRHGSAEAAPKIAPVDLYSNSTVAINVETGKLAWYYQHLPGDDWDADHIHERTLIRTRVRPDKKRVKWVNPDVKSGEVRDAVIAVGEGGGIWALDRATGQFLWASPFPYDVPEFNISGVDLKTGKTILNWNNVFKRDGDKVTTCYHNTRGYWSTAYHPGKNALYVPFHDQCLYMVANAKNPKGWGPRRGVMRPGADPDKFSSIAKVDLSTGRMNVIYSQKEPGNGHALVTAGNLLFWGDMNRRMRAFDADSGKVLWETVVGGIVQTSTISYAVNGRQYIAVMTGDGQSATAGPLRLVKMKAVRGHNAIYVFALPPRS
ncbi:MAG: quinohemoprotein ethanol dehydrogenase type [Pseudomonadota bacterium]|jgi:alcohol dehydrogenase (cytochrome c)